MAKKVRNPKTIEKDIKKLQQELKDSKDANYYAAQAKKNLSKAGKATKKYGKKAGKAASSLGNSIMKFLTTK